MKKKKHKMLHFGNKMLPFRQQIRELGIDSYLENRK